jgi:hypothetical protein
MEQKTGVRSLYAEFFRGYGAEIRPFSFEFRPNWTYKWTSTLCSGRRPSHRFVVESRLLSGLKRGLVPMHRVFCYLTLNRIGIGLFLTSLYLVFGSTIEFLGRTVPPGTSTIKFSGLTESQSLLLGLACLVLSSIVFSLANINQRLARVEAKLDSLRKSSGSENQPVE